MIYLKRLGFVLLAVVILCILLITFLPKTSLWYAVESKLQSKKIIFDGESLDENLFSLDIKESTIYAGSLNIARVQNINVMTLGLYNSVNLTNIFVGSDLKMLRGLHIEEAQASYVPFMGISVFAKGNFGSLQAEVDLSKGKYHLDIKASKWLKKQYVIMKVLKKTEKGYRFDGHF